VTDLLETAVFERDGDLRALLEHGGREEGRRAFLRCGEGARLVSLTVARLDAQACAYCEPRARFLVVARPAEDDALILQRATAAQGLVAVSEPMMRVVQLIENLHRSDASILVTGESGSGKEVVARAIHALSPMRAGPFVAVNCAALPGELLESELFGHVRGAFTGAVKDRVGRFEIARGGTIFLDEIGEVPLHLQVKLLRVLQERRFERVGESVNRTMEARVIAATNRDLAELVRAGAFRDDLYYRLRVVPVHLPPLRDRPEDIAPLAYHLLARIGARLGRAMILSPDALRVLEACSWQGNVRELENALEYAVALARGQTLGVEDLPEEVRGVARQGGVLTARINEAASFSRRDGVPLPQTSERDRIRAVLESARWSRARAATLLGMSRTTLWRRMRELGLASGA